jgi:hypothetical protein
MSRSIRAAAWARWKAFARRAAETQSAVVLWLLYYAVVVPIAFCRPSARRRWRRGAGDPSWHVRTTATPDMTSARRQF